MTFLSSSQVSSSKRNAGKRLGSRHGLYLLLDTCYLIEKRIVRRNDAAVPYVFINGVLAWKKGAATADLGNQKLGQVLRATNNQA